MNMEFIRKLPMPKEIKEQFPLPEKFVKIKKERDEQIKNVLCGKDNRFLLVIGPCSADSEKPVLEYVEKIARVQEKVKDKIIIIPRIYTNKPRTVGSGYKGMLHQPDPNEKPNMLRGIIAIRNLHLKAIEVSELTGADEMLYPENHRYLSDLLSYVAVGARSSEDQEHRLVASGLNIPVGMKNPTSGDLSVMLNSIEASQQEQTFIYRGWEVHSLGNTLTHAILRGSVNKHGESQVNYHYENLKLLYELYSKRNLKNPACIVDCNHSNSNKNYLEQIRIASEIVYSVNHSDDIKKIIKGLMIESYLVDGKQKIGDNVYGQSITDACLGFEKSEKLIYKIAEDLK